MRHPQLPHFDEIDSRWGFVVVVLVVLVYGRWIKPAIDASGTGSLQEVPAMIGPPSPATWPADREQGQVPWRVVRRCARFCGTHKSEPAEVSVLDCSCVSGHWIRM
jgi:hypothetical protein